MTKWWSIKNKGHWKDLFIILCVFPQWWCCYYDMIVDILSNIESLSLWREIILKNIILQYTVNTNVTRTDTVPITIN